MGGRWGGGGGGNQEQNKTRKTKQKQDKQQQKTSPVVSAQTRTRELGIASKPLMNDSGHTPSRQTVKSTFAEKEQT